MGKICKKCSYERKTEEIVAAHLCPKCGAVYAKVEEYIKSQGKKAERLQEAKQEIHSRICEKWDIVVSTTFLFGKSSISLNISSPAEAKIALKELKFKKKEFGIIKRKINAEIKNIKSEYTEEVRLRGSMVRGGGKGSIRSVVRSFQRISRDQRRAQLARDLSPLETKKQEVDLILITIDSSILQVETEFLND